MKIVVFGVGKKYREYKHILCDNLSRCEVVGLIDNNSSIQGALIDGFLVESPNILKNCHLKYDHILIMSASYSEMKSQLLNLGIEEKSIWSIEKYISEISKDEIKYYGTNYNECNAEVLFICGTLGFDGASMAVVSAALALKQVGILSAIATNRVSDRMLNECLGKKIILIVNPKLPFPQLSFINWSSRFKNIIINTFPLVPVVAQYVKNCNVYWWIHEASEYYIENVSKYSDELDCVKENIKKVTIACVSEYASEILYEWTGIKSDYCLPYCIPKRDTRVNQAETLSKKDRIVIGIVGLVCPRKGQLEALKKILKLDKQVINCIEVILVGKLKDDDYGKAVKNLGEKHAFINIIGELSHDEMYRMYDSFDLVLVPSKEDPLPTVVTEAMMFSKPCIISNRCGNKTYVNNMKNAIVYDYGSDDDFLRKANLLLGDINMMRTIGKASVKVYDDYFSFDAFDRNFFSMIQKK